MLVYRFETETKEFGSEKVVWKGVFHNHFGWQEDAEYSTYGSTLSEHKYYDGSRFACRSIDKLISYFGSDFARAIAMKDVRLMEYEVNARDLIYSKQHCEVVFKVGDVKSKRVVKIT